MYLKHCRILVILASASLWCQGSWALSDEEIFREFRFNLISPGARGLALGGAFLSIADDATAAESNPAGLSFFLDPEYFLELRSVDNGATSTLVNESLPAGIDTFVGRGVDPEDSVNPTFASAVTAYQSWSQGVSVQQVLNTRSDTLSSFAFTRPDSPGAFLAESRGSIDVDVINVNVSGGWRLTDKMGVGARLTYSTLDVRSEVVRTIVDTSGTIAGEVILEPRVDLRTSINDSDEDVVFSAGLIYKADRFGAGLVYRQGPSFEVLERIDPMQVVDGEVVGGDVFAVRDRLGEGFANRFNLPDSLGVGAHVLFLDGRLTVAGNIERIGYSDLLDGFVAGVNVLTTEDAEFIVDDATEFRLGGEYILLNPFRAVQALALRVGTYSEEDSTIRANFTGTGAFATEEVFGGQKSQQHGTLGVGLTVKRFQIDFAADFAKTKNQYLVSVIFRGK